MTKIIGITGGIASGKSTVTGIIRKAGYKVVDADSLVHDLQAKGGALYKALLAWLGTGILLDNGELDRSKLSALIFGNEEKRAQSAQLQNPIIRRELAKKRAELAQTESLFFMDIPLLIEQDYRKWFDAVWIVYADKSTQIRRLMERNGYSQDEAQKRLASQMPLKEKCQYADAVIDNNGSLADLQEQVTKLLKRLEDAG
ncbi:dephospho-CoA kinase [Streptococcus pantholopis]|uniref:Dephospho-CoA kinase n=1 Tax=Streptococcus pantholopis TaxID=1811193 RepID=A0A172QAC8_9STRE|nr:dephospho-CoA kinase [Streptococcus pantholopis]AND80401.1 dephospho-CoA kinase [Streptococcus pantholopis]